jgi:hypothetical protein
VDERAQDPRISIVTLRIGDCPKNIQEQWVTDHRVELGDDGVIRRSDVVPAPEYGIVSIEHTGARDAGGSECCRFFSLYPPVK